MIVREDIVALIIPHDQMNKSPFEFDPRLAASTGLGGWHKERLWLPFEKTIGQLRHFTTRVRQNSPEYVKVSNIMRHVARQQARCRPKPTMVMKGGHRIKNLGERSK
jgi:hypothetical protein